MKHLLTRADGSSWKVDSDLWTAVLEIAATNGWVPTGADAGASSPAPFDPFQYSEPLFQEIRGNDARALAEGARRGLQGVPEVELPLRDRPFGGDRTIDLLRLAATGRVPKGEHADAAVEILSGPPRSEALALVGFLNLGAFVLLPDK